MLLAGAQQQFTASVQNGRSSSVTWLVNGVSGGNSATGTISGSGLYRAPTTVASQLTVSVSARSQSDPNKSATAQVVVNPPVPVIAVSLNLASATLIGGGAQPFVATVSNSSNTAVSWFVNNIALGNASLGLITDAGDGSAVYSAPPPSLRKP